MKPNSRFAHFFLADKFISQRDLKGTVGCVFFWDNTLVKRIPMREPTVKTWRHSVKKKRERKKHGAIALETIYYYYKKSSGETNL